MKYLNICWTWDRFGRPEEVLHCIEEALDLKSLKPTQMLLGLIGAAIHPSDIGLIAGTYGRNPILPSIAGREGAAQVLEIGNQITHFKKGDWVRIPEETGAWQSYCIVEESHVLFPIIPTSLSAAMASTAFINPGTAFRLLHDFVTLQPGDWIIQNAANSAVGLYVIQIAKKLGFHTINVLRNAKERTPLLQRLGADIILEEGTSLKDFLKNTLPISKPKLALNSVGGESAVRLLQVLEDNSPLVTFGGISFEPSRFPTRYLIFNNICLLGFWMDRWLRKSSLEEVKSLYTQLYRWMEEGALQPNIDTIYPLNSLQQALSHAQSAGRHGKILLKGPCWK